MLYSLSVLSLAGAACGDVSACHAISPVVTDDWCRSNCGANPPNCPAQFCDCSDPTPTPPPPPPTPPGPPTPPPPPPPPAPPPSCAGDVVDGWFLAPWAASSSGAAPTSSCMAIYFWGLPPSQWAQFVKSTPDLYTADVLLPGSFPYKILNLGGGGTLWDDGAFEDTLNFLPTLKNQGFTGVCLDAECFGTFTMSKLLGIFAEAKKLGLTTVLTSTAEGPYLGCDSPNDCWSDIVWDNIDFMVPQMYGASGTTYGPTEFEQYANFWKNGGGQGVHGKFSGPTDLKKILWAINPGQGESLLEQYSFAGGYIDWAYKSLGSSDTVV